MSQMTLDGREVTIAASKTRARLGPTQSAVLGVLAVMPGPTSGQLDELRSGGSAAVRRLHRRGLVERHAGLWFVARGSWE